MRSWGAGSWRFGTLSSCNTSEQKAASSCHWRGLALTLAWDLSESRQSSKVVYFFFGDDGI